MRRHLRMLQGGVTELRLNPADRISADTAMGAVTLVVGDLDAMTRFYTDAITLQVLRAEGGTVELGRAGLPVIVLRQDTSLRAAPAGSAGLFHTAVLFESRAALASALLAVAHHAPGHFTGSADHAVSVAFYLTDPEGNGVELYWDRARTEWSWVHGRVEMTTLWVDPNAFVREHLPADPSSIAAEGASVGHVHLSVGDVASARAFYVDGLGFDITAEMGAALFVSAGGYHHHLAMNVWNSLGAGRRGPALGLGRMDLVLPGADDLGALAERLRDRGVAVRDDGRNLAFDDPWNNALLATTPGRG